MVTCQIYIWGWDGRKILLFFIWCLRIRHASKRWIFFALQNEKFRKDRKTKNKQPKRGEICRVLQGWLCNQKHNNYSARPKLYTRYIDMFVLHLLNVLLHWLGITFLEWCTSPHHPISDKPIPIHQYLSKLQLCLPKNLEIARFKCHWNKFPVEGCFHGGQAQAS